MVQNKTKLKQSGQKSYQQHQRNEKTIDENNTIPIDRVKDVKVQITNDIGDLLKKPNQQQQQNDELTTPIVKKQNGFTTKRSDRNNDDHKGDPMGYRKNHFGRKKSTITTTSKINSPTTNYRTETFDKKKKSTIGGNMNNKINSVIITNSTKNSPTSTNLPTNKTNQINSTQKSDSPIKFPTKEYRNSNMTNNNNNKRYNNNNTNNNNTNLVNSIYATRSFVQHSKKCNLHYLRTSQYQQRKTFTPIVPIVPIPLETRHIPSSTTISGVNADSNALTLFEKSGSGRHSYPLMQVRNFAMFFKFVFFSR